MATPAGVVAHGVSDFIPSGQEVASLLTNAVLPLTGGLMGYFFADFIGLENIVSNWMLEQVAATGKQPTKEQAQQMMWAINGACIAFYSVVLLIGLGLWGSGHDIIGSTITGFGLGLIANKLVDIFFNRK